MAKNAGAFRDRGNGKATATGGLTAAAVGRSWRHLFFDLKPLQRSASPRWMHVDSKLRSFGGRPTRRPKGLSYCGEGRERERNQSEKGGGRGGGGGKTRGDGGEGEREREMTLGTSARPRWDGRNSKSHRLDMRRLWASPPQPAVVSMKAASHAIESKKRSKKYWSEKFSEFTNGRLTSPKLPNPVSDNFSDKALCVQ